jgi:hypothetical protein
LPCLVIPGFGTEHNPECSVPVSLSKSLCLTVWKGELSPSLLPPFPSLLVYLTTDRFCDGLFTLYVNRDIHYLLTPELRASPRPVTECFNASTSPVNTNHPSITPLESYQASSILHAHTALLLFSSDSYSTLLRLSGTTPLLFSFTCAPHFRTTDPPCLSIGSLLATSTMGSPASTQPQRRRTTYFIFFSANWGLVSANLFEQV